MKDFTKYRGQINTNYLQNLLIRLDFEDIVELETSTEKAITTYLRNLNFKKNIATFSEYSFKLNYNLTPQETIEDDVTSCINSSTKSIFVFINEEKKIKIEVAPFYIIINKYENFKINYEKFEFFSDILLKLCSILKENEQILWKRIGIRKINSYQNHEKSKFIDIFQNHITSDLINNNYIENSLNYAKQFCCFDNSLKVNHRIRFQKGVLLSEENPIDIFQLLLDFDVFTENDIDIDSHPLKNLLEEMNTLLFNLYMNSYNEKIIQSHILLNKELFE